MTKAPRGSTITIRQHPLYQSLAGSNDARHAAYRCLFETELDASLLLRLRECTNGGFVLVNERFAQQIAAISRSAYVEGVTRTAGEARG